MRDQAEKHTHGFLEPLNKAFLNGKYAFCGVRLGTEGFFLADLSYYEGCNGLNGMVGDLIDHEKKETTNNIILDLRQEKQGTNLSLVSTKSKNTRKRKASEDESVLINEVNIEIAAENQIKKISDEKKIYEVTEKKIIQKTNKEFLSKKKKNLLSLANIKTKN
jgi:hypothetical protein